MAYKVRPEDPIYYASTGSDRTKAVPKRDQGKSFKDYTIIGVHVSGSTVRGNMACELTPENIEWIE